MGTNGRELGRAVVARSQQLFGSGLSSLVHRQILGDDIGCPLEQAGQILPDPVWHALGRCPHYRLIVKDVDAYRLISPKSRWIVLCSRPVAGSWRRNR
jgi:hypothetical protein